MFFAIMPVNLMTPFDGVAQRACEGCVGYTKGHLHTRVEGHRQKASKGVIKFTGIIAKNITLLFRTIS